MIRWANLARCMIEGWRVWKLNETFQQTKQYGRYPRPDPKYYPDTMVEVDGRMVRYGDLDEKYDWIETTTFSDSHPVLVRGMHWADEEPT